MAHKIMTGGTVYAAAGGKSMVDGTVYSIAKGRTMIGGTGYDIPFASATPVGDMAVGTSVYLNEAGVPAEYLIVHQGLPSDIYDTSCDGTWLLRKQLYSKQAMNSGSTKYAYEFYDVHTYLNDTFLGLLDANIQETVKQVKIPYVSGSYPIRLLKTGEDGLSAKIFLLSIYETGYGGAVYEKEGEKLDYFSSGTGSEACGLRIGLLNETATAWWLRTPDKTTGNMTVVKVDGSFNTTDRTNSRGVRPALILPPETIADTDFLIA